MVVFITTNNFAGKTLDILKKCFQQSSSKSANDLHIQMLDHCEIFLTNEST